MQARCPIPGPEAVTVVVVTFNSADLIADLVASLPAGLGEVRWRLVVADNDSRDGSAEAVRRLAPEAVVVETGRNGGYSAGINAAAEHALPGSAVLVLNPDVRLAPGCVPTLLETLREPGVGVAVPRLDDAAGELILSIRREPTLLRAYADAFVGAERAGRIGTLGEVVSDPAAYAAAHDVDWAEGSTQLVSAECWTACGGWDESFFLYSEETDFDLRAHDAGYAVRYQPAARATHLEGGSSGSPGLWRLLVLNRVRLYRRRHGLLPSALFWLATLLRESSRAALGRATSREAARALCSPRRWRQRPGPDAIRYERRVNAGA